jgi:hypothetical protein
MPVSVTELEARTASAGRYVPADPDAPMIGVPDLDVDSPIFDSISAWFSTEPTAKPDVVIDLRDDARTTTPAEPASTPTPVSAPAPAPVPAPAGAASGAGGNRWSTLGDQQWLAANARAAAGPSVAGNTDAGLPRRQPGANLLPSATEAAPALKNVPGRAPGASGTVTPSVTAAAGSAGTRPDAEAVRGRLGSYQRGLTSARRTRHLPGTSGPGATTTAQPLGESESRPQHAEQQPADQGGDH